MKQVLHRIRRFRRDCRGSVSLEVLLVLPMLIWAHLATYVYFDSYATITKNMKATYTLADMISRQTQTVTPTYINGMNKLYDYLNNNPANSWIRITSVGWDPSVKEYYVSWSYATKSHAALTDNTIQAYAPKLPTIVQGDSLILVETNMDYSPTFNVGLQASTYTQTVVTRPRISGQVAYSSS